MQLNLNAMKRFRSHRAASGPEGAPGLPLPDPALPPTARGSWIEAALTNVAVTDVVKRQVGAVTRPWQK